MNITIIGSGNMARSIAARFLTGKHNVTIVGREPAKVNALAEDLRASPSGSVKVAQAGASITDPVVVLALPYDAARAFAAANRSALAGKIVVDITNPLNATYDGLATAPGTSAGEQIAALLPQSNVVKAFNTNFAGPLSPANDNGAQDVFVAGDDARAKSVVLQLVREGGLNGIDAGRLERARQLEGLALIGITLQQPLNLNFQSSWKLVA